MTRMRSRPALLVAVASASVLLAGCTTTSGNTGGGGEGGSTDTIRTTIDIPSGFDPTQALSLPDFVLGHTSYDTLLRRGADGLVGGLATEWESTPTSATFTIRDDATCSDGTVITPTIVKDSLDYYIGGSASGTATVFGPGNVPTVTADDDAGTVVIDLSGPWPDLLNGLTIGSTGIICPAGLADPEALAAGEATGAESGPYVLQDAEAGVRYTYTLREDYDAWPDWSGIEGEPAATIEYVVSPESSATANLVLSGELDIAKIQAEAMSRFDGMDDHEILVTPFSDFYVIFNQREGSPFTDPALRKAVAQVLDRAAFENITSSGTGEITGNLVASNTQCAADNTDALIPLDPAAAAPVLDGVTIRFVGPQIMGPAGAGNEYAQEVLRAAGANVELSNVDVGTWIGTVIGQPDAWDMTIFADLNFLGAFTSPLSALTGPSVQEGGGNIGATKNAEAEALFQAALAEADDEARCDLLIDAQNALIANADTVPMINDAFIYVQRPGFSVQLLGGALDDPILRIVD